ncbi:MAG: hypothetical protein ACN4G0_03915 [Polyangiales bacterium]
MKFIWSVMVVSVAMAGCGSDDGGSSGGGTNLNNAAVLFNNPDGTVSDDNADEAVRKALDATRANNSGQLGGGFGFASVQSPAEKAIEDCISINTSNGSSVIDYVCLGPEIDADCTGQGNITTTIGSVSADGNLVANTQYNNAGITCGGEPLYSCNGPAQTSIAGETIVTCLDLVCTYDGESESSEGCFTFDSATGGNLVLVTLDDGSVVCVALVANSDCSQACSEWRDAEGESRIVCDVTETDGNACNTDGTTIQDTANCVIDRTQTSCAGF